MNKVTPVFPSVLINSMNSLFSQLQVWKVFHRICMDTISMILIIRKHSNPE